MGNYGIKVTIDGKNINSTEPRDYVLNSKYGSVKIAEQNVDKEYDTIVVNAGSNATVTIMHSLGFIPLVMLFTELKPGSGEWYMGGQPLNKDNTLAGSVYVDYTGTYADDTYVKIKYINPTGGNLTVKYYYFIFADNG